MPWHRRKFSRRVSAILTCTICCAAALVLLFTAPSAMSQSAPPAAAAAAPDNGNPFARLFRLPSSNPPPAAAPAVAAQQPQRVRKPRAAKVRKRSNPVAAQAAPAETQPAPQPQQVTAAPEQVAPSDWPSAASSVGVGAATIAPLMLKTVREQIEPEPETPIVSENELSDVDRAAEPALAQAPTPERPVGTEPATATERTIVTDGIGTVETDPTEQTRVFAMNETLNALMQAAWLEPILLMLAGALAGLAARRMFA